MAEEITIQKEYNDYDVYQRLKPDTQDSIDNFMLGHNNEGQPFRMPPELQSMHEILRRRITEQSHYLPDAFNYLQEVIDPKYFELFKKMIRVVET